MFTRSVSFILLLGGILSFSLGQSPSAQKENPLEWRYLLKAFNYDRNFKKRSAKDLNILIIHEKNKAGTLRKILGKAAKDEFGRNDIHVFDVKFKSVGALIKTVKKNHITLIYIDPPAGKKLSSILQVSRGLKIPSLTRGRRLVKSGVSIGMYRSSGKTRLIINRKAAMVEGIRFSSALFAIATLIR